MRTLKNVRVKVRGVTYTGSYEIDGDRVLLMSAYGSRSGPVARDPKPVAEKLLAQVVEGWRP